MDIQHNVVGWFEIHVDDLDRAVGFYGAVFGFKLSRHPMGPLDMAWFPGVQDGIGAAGGKVLEPKRLITQEIGYMGIVLDSEDNRIALHSRK
jgi:predicted enzyme related to lactoylglutathione lyase